MGKLKNNSWQPMLVYILMDLEYEKKLDRADTNRLVKSIADGTTITDAKHDHAPVTAIIRVKTRAFFKKINDEVDKLLGY